MSLLSARSVSVANPGAPVFRRLDFELASREVWGILGPNGVGKTTLLHLLAGLRQADAGTVHLQGQPMVRLDRRMVARNVGMLFQDSQDAFPASVLETVLTGRYPHLPYWRWESKADVCQAMEALRQVSLTEMSNRSIHTLSGGERRRLAIACLLVQQPRIWLLDEPTNHLDIHHQIVLLDLILQQAIASDGGVVMVLQDVNLAPRFCTHVMMMIDSDTRCQGPLDEVLTASNLQQLYRHPIREIRQDGLRLFYPV